MNTKIIVAILIALGVGGASGYLLAPEKTVAPEGAHMMPDGSVMSNTPPDSMHAAMGDMMAGLAGKSGDAFDRAFLTEMIVHHEGAVAMAEAALQDAKHPELKTMANAIISAQTKEIAQMKQWLREWYGE